MTAPPLSANAQKRKQLGNALALAAQLLEPANIAAEPEHIDHEVHTPEMRLREFVAPAWTILEPGRRFSPGMHIDVICEHLEAVTFGQIRRLLINMPPRHMKSLLVSVLWMAWEWTFMPHTRWLSASYAIGLATRDAVKARRLIQSPWYRGRFGHVFQLAGDQNAKMRFDNDRTGYRLATSVEGGGTGEGGDRILIDDPHKVKQAESEPQRQAVIDWWDETMSTRGNDPATVAKVVVMQRVHGADLSGHLIEQGDWNHLCLPARYEVNAQVTVPTDIGWMDPRTEEGDALWPERYPDAELKVLEKDLGSMGTAAQLQQRPVARSGHIMERAWFENPDNQWKVLPAALLNNAPGADWLISVDCSFKELKDSDFVVLQAWARWGATMYLVWQRRDRMGFTKTCNAVAAMAASFPHATLKLVEDKANGPAVIERMRALVVGLVPVEPEGSKESRLWACQPTVEAGNVKIPCPTMRGQYGYDSEGYAWVNDVVNELCLFPKAANDDQADAFSQAVQRYQKHMNQRDNLKRITDQLNVHGAVSETTAVTQRVY